MKTKEMRDQPLAKSLICLASFSICWAFFTKETESMEFVSVRAPFPRISQVPERPETKSQGMRLTERRQLQLRVNGKSASMFAEGSEEGNHEEKRCISGSWMLGHWNGGPVGFSAVRQSIETKSTGKGHM
jgi:hypothetical protein